MKNLIICGAPRAGTTSLFRYLSSHPDANISPKKELNYFWGGVLEEGYDKITSSDYLKNFNLNDEVGFTLEASPIYMHKSCYKQVGERIQSILPNSKLLFILRDPVLRLHSQYLGWARRHNELKGVTFEKFVEGILSGEMSYFANFNDSQLELIKEGLAVGKYVDGIKNYTSIVGDDRILVVFTDELSESPLLVVSRICHWLGVEDACFRNYTFNIENKMIKPRFRNIYLFSLRVNKHFEPWLNRHLRIKSFLRNIHNVFNKKSGMEGISPQTTIMLNGYYREHNENLARYLTELDSEMVLPKWLRLL
jgi:hypothetical protein